MSPSVSLRQLEDLASEKDGGKGDGGVLVTQERMTDADADKVDANAESYASDASKVDTNKIDVKRGIETKCSALISHY